MKLNKWNQMYSWLVRPSKKENMEKAKKELGIPKDTKIKDGQEILNWINYNRKMYGDSKIPVTPEERKTGEKIEKLVDVENNKKAPGKQRYVYNVAKGKLEDTRPNDWKYTSWADGQKDIEEMKIKDKQKNKRDVIEMVGDIFDVTKPKKKLVADKPKPSIQEQLDFQDHLNILDPYWWIEDTEEKPSAEDKARLRYEKLKSERDVAEGIQTLLKLDKGRIS